MVDKVPQFIRFISTNQSNISMNCFLEQIRFAVKYFCFAIFL